MKFLQTVFFTMLGMAFGLPILCGSLLCILIFRKDPMDLMLWEKPGKELFRAGFPEPRPQAWPDPAPFMGDDLRSFLERYPQPEHCSEPALPVRPGELAECLPVAQGIPGDESPTCLGYVTQA